MALLHFLFLLAPLTQAGGTQWPESCVKKQTYPCMVHAYTKIFFTIGENQYFLSSGSLVEFSAADEVYFSKGVLWVQAPGPVRIKNPFGNIFLSKKGQLMIDADENKALVSVMDGIFQIQARADKETYRLMSGQSVVLGAMDYEKKSAAISFPTVISLKDYLKSIEKVFPFADLNFQEHIDLTAKSIRQALRHQSVWDKTIVERKLANVQEEKVRQRYEKEYSLRRDHYLRKLFRQKNNFED